MTIRKVPFLYANHPTRGWLLIPSAWESAFRAAGSQLYAAPSDITPVSEPTPLDHRPDGLEVAEEAGAAALKGAAVAPASPAFVDPEQDPALAQDMAEARKVMACHPAPVSARHQAFIAPQFQAQVGKPHRCSVCWTLYAPKPTGDDGRCIACRSARAVAG